MKKVYPFFAAALFLFAAHSVSAAEIESSIVKGSGPEIYFYNGEGLSHFPAWDIYHSWAGKLDPVQVVDDQLLASIPKNRNVTVSPGFLIKFPDSPKVYLLQKPNVLRWLPNEEVARNVFAWNWDIYILTQPEELRGDYIFGEDVRIDEPRMTPSDLRRAAPNPSVVVPFTNIDRFPHPEFQEILELDLRSYRIKTNLSVDEVTTWLKDASTDFELLNSTDSLEFDSGVQLHTRETTYRKDVADGFIERTVVMSSPLGLKSAVLEYSEIRYPAGYFRFPNGTSVFYSTNLINTRQHFTTFATLREISDWYVDQADKNGWTVLRNEINVLSWGDEYGSINLVNKENANHKMSISTGEGDGFRGISVTYDTSGKYNF